MAGHSHSSNIAVRKGKQDRLRARIFSKLSKNIMIAARGGPDPAMNFSLRHAVELARAQSMPKDKIEHAIKKGAGLVEGIKVQELTYEAYGPSGVALLIDCVTDNINRTRPEIISVLDKSNAKIAEANSVKWMFKRRGYLAVKKDAVAEDKLMDIVLTAGADDMAPAEDVYEILTTIETFETVKKALDEAKIATTMSEMKHIPENVVDADAETARKVLTIVERLEEVDDVNSVHHNMKITPEVQAIMKQMADAD